MLTVLPVFYSVFVNKTNVSFKDHIDTAGLVVLAHMFHNHEAVFLASGAWLTSRNKSPKLCQFRLIYHKNGEFSEAVKVSDSEHYATWLQKYTKQRLLLSHQRKAI